MGTLDDWVIFFGVVNGNWGLPVVDSTTSIRSSMCRESPVSAFESVVVVSIRLAAVAAARSFIRARAAALADGDG